jgi:hypothetical protein
MFYHKHGGLSNKAEKLSVHNRNVTGSATLEMSHCLSHRPLEMSGLRVGVADGGDFLQALVDLFLGLGEGGKGSMVRSLPASRMLVPRQRSSGVAPGHGVTSREIKGK